MHEDLPTRPVRFIFRGQTTAVATPDPTRSVLQWLREDARACGTKEGCAEGDCGACTVIVAELADTLPEGHSAVVRDGVALRPVNSCIRFLPTLHGKALLTVEDLAQPDGTLHPAQQALVNCHGSQCGFCTPGFVMSLAVSHERQQVQGRCASRTELADDLAGNLCRCTGYRPILDAAEQMHTLPGPGLPLTGLREQLLALRASMLAGATATTSAPVHRYHAPTQLAELAQLRQALPDARLLAGGTDIGLWVTKQFRDLGTVIWLGDVAELRRITHTPDRRLHIGAAVTLEDAWQVLVRHWPTLSEMARRFAGPPVRHAGTLVGNLANGSPIGDSAPVLMALGATLHLQCGSTERSLPLESFYLGYMKNALQPGEFVSGVSVALPAHAQQQGWVHRAWKISKRFDCDISALSAGLGLKLDGETIVDARLAFGGMDAVVRRAAGAEAALRGQPWHEATMRAASQALLTDFTPLSDLRATAAYRQRAAAGLLHRLWLETRLHDPLPASATRAAPVL
ncbi:xanthine dehydrogenase small subunit [Ideonella margarita]|uniref:Xanthine dehydrogenase small subunit n=1 Tax=Ideonella margarita TaxID=2984191 RepID=A0ABU9C726_9BURK